MTRRASAGTCPGALDWQRLKKNRAAEITRLNGVYEQLLRGAGVELARGWATLCDPNTVQVATGAGARRWRARHVLVATGGTPSVPHLPGREHVLTSDSMFDLEPFRAGWGWWAAATSPASSPPSSVAWARR